MTSPRRRGACLWHINMISTIKKEYGIEKPAGFISSWERRDNKITKVNNYRIPFAYSLNRHSIKISYLLSQWVGGSLRCRIRQTNNSHYVLQQGNLISTASLNKRPEGGITPVQRVQRIKYPPSGDDNQILNPKITQKLLQSESSFAKNDINDFNLLTWWGHNTATRFLLEQDRSTRPEGASVLSGQDYGSLENHEGEHNLKDTLGFMRTRNKWRPAMSGLVLRTLGKGSTHSAVLRGGIASLNFWTNPLRPYIARNRFFFEEVLNIRKEGPTKFRGIPGHNQNFKADSRLGDRYFEGTELQEKRGLYISALTNSPRVDQEWKDQFISKQQFRFLYGVLPRVGYTSFGSRYNGRLNLMTRLSKGLVSIDSIQNNRLRFFGRGGTCNKWLFGGTVSRENSTSQIKPISNIQKNVQYCNISRAVGRRMSLPKFSKLLQWNNEKPVKRANSLLSYLESRLDIVVFRLKWARSLSEAVQLIKSGAISIQKNFVQSNGQNALLSLKKEKNPKIYLKPGCLIQFTYDISNSWSHLVFDAQTQSVSQLSSPTIFKPQTSLFGPKGDVCGLNSKTYFYQLYTSVMGLASHSNKIPKYLSLECPFSLRHNNKKATDISDVISKKKCVTYRAVFTRYPLLEEISLPSYLNIKNLRKTGFYL